MYPGLKTHSPTLNNVP